jgi:hypothetical protein
VFDAHCIHGGIVGCGDARPLGQLASELLKLGEDDRTLDGIHASAEADADMMVAATLAMNADFSRRIGDGRVIRIKA